MRFVCDVNLKLVHLSSRDQVAGGFWRRNEVSDRRLQVAKGAFTALDVAVEEKERGEEHRV
jgi:hypothetical protein